MTNVIRETFPELIASEQLIVEDDFFVNAKELDATALTKIRSSVLEYGMSYTNFGEVVPKTWRDLHMKLDELRAAGTKIVPYQEIQHINKTLPSPLGEEELKVFITFLHDMGYCLHFEGGDLGNYVILEPKWIIDAMKVFVTCDRFGLRFWKRFEWMRMRSSGQVQEKYILQQWRSRNKESFHQFREYLLLVLEKLDILCRAKLYGRSGEDVNAEFFTVLAWSILQWQILSYSVNLQLVWCTPFLLLFPSQSTTDWSAHAYLYGKFMTDISTLDWSYWRVVSTTASSCRWKKEKYWCRSYTWSYFRK